MTIFNSSRTNIFFVVYILPTPMEQGEVSALLMLRLSERSLFVLSCDRHVIGSKGLFSRHTWVAKLQKPYSFCNYSCNFGLQKWPRNHEKSTGTIVYTVITDHDTDHMYQFLCRFYNLGCKTNVTRVSTWFLQLSLQPKIHVNNTCEQ